mgnify:CR=1 FL=1
MVFMKFIAIVVFTMSMLSIFHLYFQKSILNAHSLKTHHHVNIPDSVIDSVETPEDENLVVPEEEYSLDVSKPIDTTEKEKENMAETDIEKNINDMVEDFRSFDEHYNNIVRDSVKLNHQSILNNINEFRL